MKTVRLLLLPLLSIAAVPATAGSSDVGTSAGQFLKLPVAGLGEFSPYATS